MSGKGLITNKLFVLLVIVTAAAIGFLSQHEFRPVESKSRVKLILPETLESFKAEEASKILINQISSSLNSSIKLPSDTNQFYSTVSSSLTSNQLIDIIKSWDLSSPQLKTGKIELASFRYTTIWRTLLEVCFNLSDASGNEKTFQLSNGLELVKKASYGSLISDPTISTQPSKESTISLIHQSSGNKYTIQGRIHDSSLAFLGIPYAEPPVGSLRWKATQALTWSSLTTKADEENVIDATEWGAACPQRCVLPRAVCPRALSEDCLSINIYTPRQERIQELGGSLPVMTFLHGGAFEFGGSGSDAYQGTHLAARGDVIVVSYNYRLGALGWAKSKTSLAGNFGFHDQITGLQWIQDNIAAFGGDPDNVTLFGNSAGAQSVVALLSSPSADHLFHKAIIQSAPLALSLKAQKDAAAVGAKLLGRLGCEDGDSTCLSGLTVAEIVDVQFGMKKGLTFWSNIFHNFLLWIHTIDPGVIDFEPFDLIVQDGFRPPFSKPVIIGSVAEEGRMFVPEIFPSMPQSASNVIASLLFPSNVMGLWNRYTEDNDYHPDGRESIIDLFTDFIFGCPAVSLADELSSAGMPVYHYYFNATIVSPSSTTGWMPNHGHCDGSPCHGVEVAFVFGSWDGYPVGPTQEIVDVTTDIQTAWIQFAKTANPSTEKNPWPTWNTTTQRSLVLSDDGTSIQSAISKQHCDFWSSSVGWDVYDHTAHYHNLDALNVKD